MLPMYSRVWMNFIPNGSSRIRLFALSATYMLPYWSKNISFGPFNLFNAVPAEAVDPATTTIDELQRPFEQTSFEELATKRIR